MPQFRKKPVVIEARQFDGHVWTAHEITQWAHEGRAPIANSIVTFDELAGALRINTLEGEMVAWAGDWIIRGVKDEFYPCKPDIFAATYEPVTPAGETPHE